MPLSPLSYASIAVLTLLMHVASALGCQLRLFPHPLVVVMRPPQGAALSPASVMPLLPPRTRPKFTSYRHLRAGEQKGEPASQAEALYEVVTLHKSLAALRNRNVFPAGAPWYIVNPMVRRWGGRTAGRGGRGERIVSHSVASVPLCFICQRAPAPPAGPVATGVGHYDVYYAAIYCHCNALRGCLHHEAAPV